jgi:hypothetical protein
VLFDSPCKTDVAAILTGGNRDDISRRLYKWTQDMEKNTEKIRHDYCQGVHRAPRPRGRPGTRSPHQQQLLEELFKKDADSLRLLDEWVLRDMVVQELVKLRRTGAKLPHLDTTPEFAMALRCRDSVEYMTLALIRRKAPPKGGILAILKWLLPRFITGEKTLRTELTDIMIGCLDKLPGVEVYFGQWPRVETLRASVDMQHLSAACRREAVVCVEAVVSLMDDIILFHRHPPS